MVRKKKRARRQKPEAPEALSVTEIDYVGYNAILSTQLLIEQLKQLKAEILAVKVIVSEVLSRLPESAVRKPWPGRLQRPIVLKKYSHD